jgi:hypothetical protein
LGLVRELYYGFPGVRHCVGQGRFAQFEARLAIEGFFQDAGDPPRPDVIPELAQALLVRKIGRAGCAEKEVPASDVLEKDAG